MLKTHFLKLCCCTLIACVEFASAGELQWLGFDEQKYRLGMNYGYAGADETVLGLTFSAPTPAYSSLNLAWANYEVSDGENLQKLKDYTVAWESDSLRAWSLALQYGFKGKSDAVEVTQYHLALFKNNLGSKQNWRIGFNHG